MKHTVEKQLEDKRITAPVAVDPDFFDAIDVSAMIHGGIGANATWDHNNGNVPYCLGGHIDWLTTDVAENNRLREHVTALTGESVIGFNDELVQRINKQKNRASHKPTWQNADRRVSFDEYCAESGWIRGLGSAPCVLTP